MQLGVGYGSETESPFGGVLQVRAHIRQVYERHCGMFADPDGSGDYQARPLAAEMEHEIRLE